MANRQNSKFGSDGYKELYLKEELQKKSNRYQSPIVEKRAAKEKELLKLKKEEAKLKTKSSRASKLLVPRGSGKQLRG
jgi:hypothetical protein